MAQDVAHTELFDLISEIQVDDGVCFDPDNIALHGLYSDELSAHRAKRGWSETLESAFHLEPELDFSFKVSPVSQRGKFILTCIFISATARYAFWRITHHQAPEAQYQIETAHVPNCESKHDEMQSAPDMEPTKSEIRSALDRLDFHTGQETISLLDRIMHKIRSIVS